MKKYLSILSCSILVLFLCAASAHASSFTVKHFEQGNVEDNAVSAMETWAGDWANQDDYTILENFGDVDISNTDIPGDYDTGRETYESTGIGATFTAGGEEGEGTTSFSDTEAQFGIVHKSNATVEGGERTTNWNDDSFFGEQYLDSGDVERITLNNELKDQEYSRLFFFLDDVADVGGDLTIQEGDGSNSTYTIADDKAPGTISFVGLKASKDSFIEAITMEMSTNNDGYGIATVGTAPVPEPTTLLLLGTGLLGLAGISRRKFFNKKK